MISLDKCSFLSADMFSIAGVQGSTGGPQRDVWEAAKREKKIDLYRAYLLELSNLT